MIFWEHNDIVLIFPKIKGKKVESRKGCKLVIVGAFKGGIGLSVS